MIPQNEEEGQTRTEFPLESIVRKSITTDIEDINAETSGV